MSFKEINVTEINENFIKNIGDEWMLISAGDQNKYNMMTASWGFAGVMWGSPMAIAAVRPGRYTMEFLKEKDYFTLSFYGDDKKIHTVCGKESGRDVNKTEKTGLTPLFDEETNAPYFDEARLVLICKKVYVQDLDSSAFLDEDIKTKWYPNEDYHTMFYGKIEKALVKE
ncbi:MAG: flavin reductase family protein [Ruminococcaceae bacterium]|nr:flavin reductase family protein [Oscillospiraceae bacterium]